MPRLAANLSMMFNEVPFLDRFDAAAQSRVRGACEFLFPYEFPAAEIAPPAGRRGLHPGAVQHAAGRLGRAVSAASPRLPGRQAEFREGVKQALDYAAALDCQLVHCMAGILPAGRAAAPPPPPSMPPTSPGPPSRRWRPE